MKCNHDCFNCIYEDCINDTLLKTEREIQDYRDACIVVTGKMPKAHGSGKNVPRRGGRYTTNYFKLKEGKNEKT